MPHRSATNAPVAQLDRATGFEPVGRGSTLRAHHPLRIALRRFEQPRRSRHQGRPGADVRGPASSVAQDVLTCLRPARRLRADHTREQLCRTASVLRNRNPCPIGAWREEAEIRPRNTRCRTVRPCVVEARQQPSPLRQPVLDDRRSQCGAPGGMLSNLGRDGAQTAPAAP